MLAVVATTASAARSDEGGEVALSPHIPIRTCIGCRGRAPAAELLRVVVAPDATGEVTQAAGLRPAAQPVALPVVPDPRRRATGRGAWVHLSPGCVETAVRRRAFARALHVPGPIDAEPVLALVATGSPEHGSSTVHHHQRIPAGDDEQ